MLLVKQFDTRKRNEERRKKMEELRLEREKEKERRTETRRMELEILSEMKRPVEDMAVPDPRLVTGFLLPWSGLRIRIHFDTDPDPAF